MLVRVKRQRDAEGAPYWQTFRCEVEPTMTVSSLLDRLNYTDDLYDVEGEPAPRIRWECSCLQKMCGACAMLANETYLLALQSADRVGDLKAAYASHFARGCSKALSCAEVCPMEIDTLASLATMNRLHAR